MLKLLCGIALSAGLIFGPGLARSSTGTELACYSLAEFAKDNTKFLPVLFRLTDEDSAKIMAYYNKLRAKRDLGPIEADVIMYGYGFWADGKADLYVTPVNKGCVVNEQAGRLTSTEWAWAKARARVVEKGFPVIIKPGKPI